MGFLDIFSVFSRCKPGSEEGKKPEDEPIFSAFEISGLNELIEERILCEPFHGPLERIPRNMTEVYKTFGRAPKETTHSQYPKAKMTIAENLPGKWNGGKPRLYMLADMEPYLREALRRIEGLGLIDSIGKVGCYNHRHIRHNENLPLSYHSWGLAVDIDSTDNKPYYRQGEEFMSPFSKSWLAVYPRGLKLNVVLAFKSVGFAWGGDWGHDGWVDLVTKYGVGYDDALVPYDWGNVTYTDPMHFELIYR